MKSIKSLTITLFGLLLFATSCNNTINQPTMNEQTTTAFQGSIGNQTYTFQIPNLNNWKVQTTSIDITYTSTAPNGPSITIPVQQLEIKAKPDYLDSFTTNPNKIQYKQDSTEEDVRLRFHLDGSFIQVGIPKYDKFDSEAVAKGIINSFKIN